MDVNWNLVELFWNIIIELEETVLRDLKFTFTKRNEEVVIEFTSNILKLGVFYCKF